MPKPTSESRRAARKGHRPATETAYRAIKQRILDNVWPAGFQALEQELADELGLSRTPVREALIRLANEGLVEVRPRHGMRVPGISADDMQEIYELLTALESTAAGLLAERGLGDDQLDSLQRALSDMDAALEVDDLDEWARADERFHRLLVDFCGNRRLMNMVSTCRDQAHRARLLTLRLRPRPGRSNDDHRATLDAIIRGDPAAAHESHWQHRVRAGRMLVDLLRNQVLSAL